MDRNTVVDVLPERDLVALRKESVDRNITWRCASLSLRFVALRKESVDRNPLRHFCSCGTSASLSARRAWIEISGVDFAEDWLESLSARRAWIEMGVMRQNPGKHYVALRKESVDRNKTLEILPKELNRSLSARRAWIEMVITAMTSQISVVALRKESVDRNDAVQVIVIVVHGRSPQGERG